MSFWGNIDTANSEPQWPKLREVREFALLTTANSTSSGATTIIFNGVGANTAANLGITVGMYANAANLAAANSEPGFFKSNVRVTAVTTNVVTFSAATFGTIEANSTVQFDSAIVYPTGEVANTYSSDTILVTATRIVNANVIIANTGTGWTHVYRTTNNDGTVRFRKEVLVALANATASNTFSGNTTQNTIYRGV
jgi:hypothetical protein